jgi:hypothetical protein
MHSRNSAVKHFATHRLEVKSLDQQVDHVRRAEGWQLWAQPDVLHAKIQQRQQHSNSLQSST